MSKRAISFSTLVESVSNQQIFESACVAICKTCNISRAELFSVKRDRNLVDARKVVAKYLIENTNYTYAQLGKLFNRNHATLIHMRKSTAIHMEMDREFQLLYAAFIAQLVRIQNDTITVDEAEIETIRRTMDMYANALRTHHEFCPAKAN